MCTLGGFLSKDGNLPNIDIVLNIVDNIDLRGRDAFGGVFIFKDNTVRKETTTSKLEMSNLVKVFLPHLKGMILTGRAIPATERVYGEINTARDSQPFMNEEYIVAHNGLISNDKQLKDRFNLSTTSEVDTAVIPPLLSRLTRENISFNDIIESVNGSFAFTIYDRVSDIFHIITNFMPLYYYHQNDVTYWASLPTQLPSGQQVPYHSIISWSLKEDRLSMYKLRNTQDNNKVAVICSGGLDSVTTLRLYQVLGFDTTMIHYKYGQKAQKVEDYITAKIADKLGIQRLVVDVTDLFKNTRPSVLLGNKNIDETQRHLDAESTLSYVGARNLIFTSLTMGIVEKMGIGVISLGLNLDDSVYNDNNFTFLNELTRLSHLSLDQRTYMRVTAPFVHLTKKEIIEVGIAIGTPFDLQVSCYYPELKEEKVIACGSCGCDKLREFSFKAIGVIDPVPFTNVPDWGRCETIESKFPMYKELLKPDLRLRPNQIPYFNYMYI